MWYARWLVSEEQMIAMDVDRKRDLNIPKLIGPSDGGRLEKFTTKWTPRPFGPAVAVMFPLMVLFSGMEAK